VDDSIDQDMLELADEDHSDNRKDECLCGINDCLGKEDIARIPPKWSRQNEETALDIIRMNRSDLAAVYLSSEQVLMCLLHLRQLAKAVGLAIGKLSQDTEYWVLVKRLAFISHNSPNREAFNTLHRVRPTYKWFRSSHTPPKEPRQRNLLEPFRFSLALPPAHFIACLEDVIEKNADRIFCAIQSISGVVEPTTTISQCRESFLENDLLDFPNLFQWFFHTSSDGPSIADMGVAEAEMMFHHTKSVVREQVRETGLMFPHQQGLIQQVAEQDIMLYLLMLLIQPEGQRNFRLMAHPQALFYAENGNLKTSFTIPSDVTRGEDQWKSDPARTLISLTPEDNGSCDTVVHGVASHQAGMDYFLRLYQEGHAEHSADPYELRPGCQLREEYVRHISTIEHERFQVEASPMATGTLRMASSVLPYNHSSYAKRVVLQPQLVDVRNGEDMVMLQNARRDACPMPKTAHNAPYPAHHLASWPLHDVLPCATPLAEAVMSCRSWEDPLVLSHLHWLLTCDNATLVQHITDLQRATYHQVAQRFQSLCRSESLMFGAKSVDHGDEADGLNSDAEMGVSLF
jgi:hypothetical protein